MELDKIVQEFLVESHEGLDQLDSDLVALRRDPTSRTLVARIFRAIHTINGTSGFLAFNRLEALTHAGESLLSRMRDGTAPVTPATTGALLTMVDGVRALLAAIEIDGSEGDVDVAAIVAAVNAQFAAGTTRPGDPADATPNADNTVTAAPPAPPADIAPTAPPAGVAPPAAAPVADIRRPFGAILVESGGAVDADVTWALRRQIEGDDRKLGTILLDEGKTMTTAVNEALTAQQGRRGVADSSIRVDVGLLDGLMNLVGELALVRNQLARAASEVADPVVVRTTQRLNLITSELQEGIMKTRMQPIGHVWSKMPRLVSDLSQACGKQVRLAMIGKETELDRSLLEAVRDPLTHLVRNAIEHGVEQPDQRTAAGKIPEATLVLRACHDGDHVTLEVTDDGGGIDVARVRQTAIARGVVTPDQADAMDDREIILLVFQPTFAADATRLPETAVGMDVIKNNIERVGGTVDVESTLGEGTTWRLSIPLTVAIIQALAIECAGERYVVPQAAVRELVYIDGQATKIEYVSGAPVYRLRDRMLPLVRLDAALGMPTSTDEGVYAVVLQADGRRFGVVVDRVLNTEEVVVKALTSRFKDIGMYAGATILGDGKVALILDVPALARAQASGGVAVEREPVRAARPPAGGAVDRLLITGVGDRRVAIPLDAVTRLEEFPADRIERVGAREVLREGDVVIPLVRLSSLLGAVPEQEGDTVAVVVYNEGQRSVALVVDRIVDVVETAATSRGKVEVAGLLGAAVIERRVTELLDVRRAILAADPQFYTELSTAMAEA